MARNPILIKDPRLEEAALRAAVSAHNEKVAELNSLESAARNQNRASQEAQAAIAELDKAKAEAEAKAREAELAMRLKEESLAKAAQLAQEAEGAAKNLDSARKAAQESGQLIASAYDEHESAILYGKLAEAIGSVPNLHPHIILFALDLARDTVVRKARKRYGIPG